MSRNRSQAGYHYDANGQMPHQYRQQQHQHHERPQAPTMDPKLKAFLVRSLSRNDQELAALQEIHAKLRLLKQELEERHPRLLLELGRGKIRLATATVSDNEPTGDDNESQRSLSQGDPINNPSSHGIIVDRLMGTTDASNRLVEELQQQQQQHEEQQDGESNDDNDFYEDLPLYNIAVTFLLHFQLRRRLLNRLARRLLRVSNAVDKNQVPETPTLPSYGDLHLHVDPQAADALEQLRLEQQRVLQETQRLGMDDAAQLPKKTRESKDDNLEATAPKSEPQVDKDGDAVMSSPKSADGASSSPNKEQTKAKEGTELPLEDRNKVLADCLPRLEYQVFLEYKDAYEKQIPLDTKQSKTPGDNDDGNNNKPHSKKPVPPSRQDKPQPHYTMVSSSSPNDDNNPTVEVEDYEKIPLNSTGIGATSSARMMQTTSERKAEFQRYKTGLLSKIPKQPRLFAEPHVYHYKKRLAKIEQDEKDGSFQRRLRRRSSILKKRKRRASSISPTRGGKTLKRMSMVDKDDDDDKDDSKTTKKVQTIVPRVSGIGKTLKRLAEHREEQKSKEEAGEETESSNVKKEPTEPQPEKETSGAATSSEQPDKVEADEGDAEKEKEEKETKRDVEQEEEESAPTKSGSSDAVASDNAKREGEEEEKEDGKSSPEKGGSDKVASDPPESKDVKQEPEDNRSGVPVENQEPSADPDKEPAADSGNGHNKDQTGASTDADQNIDKTVKTKVEIDGGSKDDSAPPSLEKTGETENKQGEPTSDGSDDEVAAEVVAEVVPNPSKEDVPVSSISMDEATAVPTGQTNEALVADDATRSAEPTAKPEESKDVASDASEPQEAESEKEHQSPLEVEGNTATLENDKMDVDEDEETDTDTNNSNDGEEEKEERSNTADEDDDDDEFEPMETDTVEDKKTTNSENDENDGEAKVDETNGDEAKDGEKKDDERKKNEQAEEKNDASSGKGEAQSTVQANDDDEEDCEDPVQKMVRPLSLVPTPSFYDQDYERTKRIHAALMTSSLQDHANSKLEESTQDYNNCLQRSTNLAERRAHYTAQLQEMNRENQTYVNQVNSAYQAKYNAALAHWKNRKRQADKQKLDLLMPHRHNPQWMPEGFGMASLYMRSPNCTHEKQIVARYVGGMVDAVQAISQGKQNPKFREEFRPPPRPDAGLSHKQRMEEQIRQEIGSLDMKLRTSEEDRQRAWRKMMKTKGEFEVPHLHNRQLVPINLQNYHSIPIPPLRHSTQAYVPPVATRPSAAKSASYVPQARRPAAAPESSSVYSKYSASKVRARISSDGSVAPVTTPKRTKDGLFQRPAGRTRKGMEWDAVRGIWRPSANQQTNPH